MRTKNAALLAAMVSKNMSGREVCTAAGITETTLSLIVNNRRKATRQTARAIAKALRTTPQKIGLCDLYKKEVKHDRA